MGHKAPGLCDYWQPYAHLRLFSISGRKSRSFPIGEVFPGTDIFHLGESPLPVREGVQAAGPFILSQGLFIGLIHHPKTVKEWNCI